MGLVKKSSFNRRSTAEEVTEGLDLSGKLVFITGINSGLGNESMRVLAKRGAHIIGAARTLEKATAACSEIDGETTPVACELSSPESIRACAKQVKAEFGHIDVLMCNAGIMAPAQLELLMGLERQFATNHMGHFQLVTQLLGLVEAAPAGRIVMLSSMGHTQAPRVVSFLTILMAVKVTALGFFMANPNWLIFLWPSIWRTNCAVLMLRLMPFTPVLLKPIWRVTPVVLAQR